MTAELKAPIDSVPLYQKRWFRRALVAASVVVLAIFVAATLFFINWWNSPEKALLDAADYMVKNAGSYHVTAKDTDLTMTIQEGSYAASGTFDGLRLSAIFSGNTLYVKSPEPDKLYEFFMGTSASAMPAVVTQILPTVKDKWVSVNLSNMSLQSRSALTLQCIAEERDTIAHNPDARRQWGSVYLANRFLSSKSTKSANASTLDVTIDKQKRESFFKDLLDTDFYRTLSNCSRDTDIFGTSNLPSPVATVVVSEPEHILQKVTIDPRGAKPVTVTSNYGNVTPIVIPSNPVSSDQLFIRYLESIGSPIPQ